MVENHNVERTQSYQLRIVRVERDRAVEWDSTDPSWQIYKSLFRFGQQIILVKFPAELNKFTNGIAWRISSQLDIWPRHDALCWRLVNEELKSTSAFLLRNRVETIRSSEGERGGERERETERRPRGFRGSASGACLMPEVLRVPSLPSSGCGFRNLRRVISQPFIMQVRGSIASI